MVGIARLVSTDIIGRATGKIAEYLLIFLIAKFVGSSELGIFAFGLTILHLGSAFSRFGMDVAVQKFIPKYEYNINLLSGTIISAFLFSATFGIILSLIILLSEPFLDDFGIEISYYVSMMVLGIPLYSVYKVGESATRGFQMTRPAVIIREFVHRGGALFLVVGAIIFGLTIEYIILFYLLSLVLASIVAFYYLNQLGAFSGLFEMETRYKELLSYSVPVTFISVAHPLILWSDILILGYYVTSSQIGIYEVAYQTSVFPTFAMIGLGAIFPAIASGLYDTQQHKKLIQIYQVSTKWVLYVAVFLGLYILINSQAILNLFGYEFSKAGTILYVLVIAQVISVATGPVNHLLSMTENERIDAALTLIVAAINIILNIWLISRFDILGAAIATSISIILLDISRIVVVWKNLRAIPYTVEYIRIVPSLGISILLVLISSIFFDGLTSLLIGGITGLATLFYGGYQAINDRDKILLGDT